MTDKELNEAIFKAKGWEFGRISPHLNITAWRKVLPDGYIDTEDYVPDYTHDWRLCGELLEEMGQSGEVELSKYRDKWQVDIPHMPTVYADTPQRAICEAWLAWKEGK